MLVLANLSGLRDGKAHPSLNYLARLLGCSISAARAAIRELEDAGLLERQAEFAHGRWEGGRQKSNVYRLLAGPVSTAGTLGIVSTGRTRGTEGTEGAAGASSAPGTVSTPPLVPAEGPPSHGLEPSEDQATERNERSNGAAGISSAQWQELGATFDVTQCRAIAQLVATAKPSGAALAEGVGRLLARKPDNPAGYLAVVLRGMRDCAAAVPDVVAESPARVLIRRIPELELQLGNALSRGDLDKHVALQHELDRVKYELRCLVARTRGVAA